MKITFLGTRGEIEARTTAHAMHSALLISHRRRRVMVDCGRDWLGRINEIRPHSVVLTHAHPDHAFGLRDGAPCAVYATRDTWLGIKSYPITDPRPVEPRVAIDVEGMTFEAFPVEHAITAPAVGYRITAGAVAVFYAPDLVSIHDRADALRGIRTYIGDGATMARPLVRRRGDTLFGHTPVRTQLGWCQAEGVPHAIITHCGSQIVTGDHAKLIQQLDSWAAERGLTAEFAYDGMEMQVRPRR